MPTNSSTANTFSGCCGTSGRPPAASLDNEASASWGTSRSWSAVTARTCGVVSTNSTRARPSARRPIPSTPNRIGGCRSFDGRSWRRRGFPGGRFEFGRPGGGAAHGLPVAEDLGTIPPFVRETLSRMGIAGHKVLRWERDDGIYRDPASYPYVSLTTPGTHDTGTLSTWWKTLPDDERRAFLKLFDYEDVRRSKADQAGLFTDEWHRLVLDRLIGSGSGLVILPLQDVFGHDEQINVPATVGPHNWTYRLPCPIEELSRPPLDAKGRTLSELLIRHGRASRFARG